MSPPTPSKPRHTHSPHPKTSSTPHGHGTAAQHAQPLRINTSSTPRDLNAPSQQPYLPHPKKPSSPRDHNAPSRPAHSPHPKKPSSPRDHNAPSRPAHSPHPKKPSSPRNHNTASRQTRQPRPKRVASAGGPHDSTVSILSRGTCHLCESELLSDDAQDVDNPDAVHSRVYDGHNFEEEAHGWAGTMVKRMGILAYVLFFVVPLAYVAIFFALVPLGEPKETALEEQAVFLFVSNAGIMMAISYLYNATFLLLARAERPFRTSVIPIFAVYLAEIVLFAPVLLTVGVFDWLGVVALGVCYITLFVSMYFTYRDLRNKLHAFFRRFMLLLILYIPLLSGFVIAYRETTKRPALQAFISFMFAFMTFVYRRIMLSKLDPFPLDASQLIAGFWVQNLGDSTFILAFPQVADSSVYAALFLSSALQNILFLVFVTNFWIYKIRPALKTYALNILKCNYPIPAIPKPDESFDPVNRGHDANVGGYRRRQFRFFFYRLLSQGLSMLMYLGVSPMLRFGFNQNFTPLKEYSEEKYRNSLVYAAGNFGFIIAVGLVGYFYLYRRHHATFHEIREIHRHDLVHHTMVGMVIAIITHNMILTLAIILSHYCVYASFRACVLENVPTDDGM